MVVLQKQPSVVYDSEVNSLLSDLRNKGMTREQEKVVLEIVQSLFKNIPDKGLVKDAISTLKEITTNSKFKFEHVGLLKHIVDKTGSYSWSALHTLNFIIGNSGFSEKDWDVLEQLVKKSDKDTEEILWKTDLSLSSSEGKSWKLITFVVQKSRKETNPLKLIKSLNAMAENKDLNVENTLKMYDDGKKIAKEVGASYDDPLVCINFAYSLSVIGEEKTRTLYLETGIEYFARYSKNMLEEVYSNLNKATKAPLLIVAFNKCDFNGVFYKEGKNLDSFLRSKYKILIFECASEDEFYSKIGSFAKSHGKIHTLIIGGHGEPHKIMLGGNTEKSRLDLTDRGELAKIKDNFVKNPKIVLVACSTGKDSKSIGAVISSVMDATVFAPSQPDHTTAYVIGEDGLIKNVRYKGPTKKFLRDVPRRIK